MTPAELGCLVLYKSKVPGLTLAEARDLANMSKEMAEACGPGDIAYSKFSRDAKMFTEYADLLEKEQQAETAP
jgi:hypothetical protein